MLKEMDRLLLRGNNKIGGSAKGERGLKLTLNPGVTWAHKQPTIFHNILKFLYSS
jgi:hypothetical protein